MMFLLIAASLWAGDKVWRHYSNEYRARFHGVNFKKDGEWVTQGARPTASAFWNLHPRIEGFWESFLGLDESVRGEDVKVDRGCGCSRKTRKGEKPQRGKW